jgi:hypothetical protein
MSQNLISRSQPPSQLFAPALLALLRRQAGVVSRAQAVRAGLTATQVDRLVARRRWAPLHPRVYRASEYPLTDEARLRAAVLWAGAGAVPRGRAALWWHGLLPDAPQTIMLTVPGRCPDPRPGVDVCRRVLRDHDVIILRGLTVPVRPLALLDAAVEAGSGGAMLLIALRGHVRLAELQAVAGHAIGAAGANRVLTDVSCTPPAHRAEWQTSRNRYS